jgi:hypothetical protein
MPTPCADAGTATGPAINSVAAAAALIRTFLIIYLLIPITCQRIEKIVVPKFFSDGTEVLTRSIRISG